MHPDRLCPGTAHEVDSEADSDARVMIPVDEARLQVVYIAPDIDFSIYNKVMFAPAGIKYRRGSGRMYKLNERDRKKLGEEFIKAMSEQLTSDGADQIVTEPGPDTLLIVVALDDMWLIFTKDSVRGHNSVLGEYVIQMTLLVEIQDSDTREVLVQAADRQGKRGNNYMRRVTSIDAWKEVRRAFGFWAKSLREGLNEARAKSATGE